MNLMALGMTAAMVNTMLESAVRAAGPQTGGTLRIGAQGGSTTNNLDPAPAASFVPAQVNLLWGEPLVALSDDGGLDDRVAESFEGSADAKTWRFKIRQGITFSNGQPVTPQDVVDTIDHHAGEDTKFGALGLLRDIEKVAAEGDDTALR